MKKNLSKDVLNSIKDEILMNRLHGGDALSEADLCARFNVSRTPVRQALQKLASWGLVEIKDGSGTYVTMIANDTLLGGSRNYVELYCNDAVVKCNLTLNDLMQTYLPDADGLDN